MTDRATESSSEILRQVRRIEIKTRGLSNDIFAGKYHSAFKGRGMAFSEVREYRMGDDVRDIDWNVTARSMKPHIKVYEEERELTMMLLVDVSGSRMFPSQEKYDHRNRRRAGFLGRAEQRQGRVHLFQRQGREVHPAEKRTFACADDHQGADRVPPRERRDRPRGRAALPDQRS